MKRKYGNRPNWKRILEREYAQTYLETDSFKGHISLLKMKKVKDPLYVNYANRTICIANEGYFWLQQFPYNKHHCVTTMFNDKGEIVQWYIDICYRNGVGKEGIPWMDDLFLDIIVLPTGEVIQKDLDELDEALLRGTINQSLYHLAKQEARKVNSLIVHKQFALLQLSHAHMELLSKSL